MKALAHAIPLLTLSTGVPLMAGPSAACPQESIFGLITPNTTPMLVEIDVSAGAVTAKTSVSLPGITPGPITSFSIERVNSEVWVGTSDGVVRYKQDPLAYEDRFLEGESIRSLQCAAGGILVIASGRVFEVDAGGAVLRSAEIPTNTTDIAPFQGGYLLATRTGVFRTDSMFQLTTEFGEDAYAAASTMGFGYRPERVNVLQDGRVAVAAESSVALFAADGTTLSVFNPGLFELDVLEIESGQLLVPTLIGNVLLDPETGTAWSSGPFSEPGFVFAVSSPAPSSAPFTLRRCDAAVNSTGEPAALSLLGSQDSDAAQLAVAATDLPPNVPVLTIFGSSTYSAPFGSGTLCISPFSPGILRAGVTMATGVGSSIQPIDFSAPSGGGLFVRGSTWHFQMLYRDQPGEINGTDSVSLTFSL